MFFKPESDDTLAVTVFTREAFSTSLESAEPGSLDSIHIVIKAGDIEELYDADAVASFGPLLRPEGEVTVHALSTGGMPSDGDLETIKMSCVLAGLRVETEAECEDGSRILTAKKMAA